MRAARDYSDALARLVDLHRFDLMAALHWPLPANLEWERLFNDVLWRQLAMQRRASDGCRINIATDLEMLG